MSTELTEPLILNAHLTESNIDINTLQNVVEQSLLDNNNSNHTLEIVHILGGIDSILKNYIKITQNGKEDQLLSQPQIQQIHDIITNEHPEKSNNNDNTVMCYRQFFKRDTFLYQLLEHKYAYRITRILWDKFVICFISIMTFIWYFPAVLFRNIYSLIWFYLFELIWFVIFTIYFLLILLSLNRAATKHIIKRFDFWIKVYYAMKIIILSAIYYTSNELYTTKQSHVFLFARVASTLVIIIFSSADGFHISWRKMLIMGVLLSTLFSIDSLRWTFDNRPDTFLYIYHSIKMSLVSEISGATRILSLFLWKQTVQIAVKRGRTCILIRDYPTIEWIERPRNII